MTFGSHPSLTFVFQWRWSGGFVVCTIFSGCVQQALSCLWPRRLWATLCCTDAIATTTKAVKKSRNNSVASFIACIASPSMMQLQDGRCSKPALTPIPVPFAVSLSPQTRYQRSWWSLYTGTSTTRSTWSLPWPACSSLQSCTAGPEAWSSAAMPSNLCWDTTPSSRLWLRKACTWPTRTGWWRREIWPARPYTWWVDVNMAEHVTENILIVLLVFTFYSSVFCMFTPKRYMSTM